jgi:arginase
VRLFALYCGVRPTGAVEYAFRRFALLPEDFSGKLCHRNIRETAIRIFDLERLRSTGIAAAASQAVEILRKHQLGKFWIHLDADVLDDAIMPAVGYRLAG